jgi:hypothetical protein
MHNTISNTWNRLLTDAASRLAHVGLVLFAIVLVPLLLQGSPQLIKAGKAISAATISASDIVKKGLPQHVDYLGSEYSHHFGQSHKAAPPTVKQAGFIPSYGIASHPDPVLLQDAFQKNIIAEGLAIQQRLCFLFPFHDFP